ncbi:hypothetical protein EDD79_103815 [Serpentinicella alkaliphila]|uniref:ISXO2 transposase-like protein n=1 Tax=Serpentinicella alkaliphila TaxID=1734049 RepID=A0A4V2T2W0_9FIRM|nr:hypothetical protein EDD79_103815 [Serpentinicella alkaliphila]
MINGYSIRKCADIVEISVPTTFFWRHKIIDAIRTFVGMGSVGGVVEVDETFFRESFKGNHKKAQPLPCPENNEGEEQRVVKAIRVKRKKEESPTSMFVCYVLCAMDRAGNIMTELICKGRMKHTDIERFFENRIDDDSIFCTDNIRVILSLHKIRELN